MNFFFEFGSWSKPQMVHKTLGKSQRPGDLEPQAADLDDQPYPTAEMAAQDAEEVEEGDGFWMASH